MAQTHLHDKTDRKWTSSYKVAWINAQSKKYDFIITSALIRYNVHIVVRAFLSVNTNLNANRKWCVWEDVIRRTALWLKGNFPTDCVSLCHGAWSDGEPRQTAVTSVTSWLVTWSEALAYRHPALFSPRASPAWDRMLVKRDKDRLINRWDQTSKPEMEQTEASGTSETLPISIIRTQEKERESGLCFKCLPMCQNTRDFFPHRLSDESEVGLRGNSQ